MQTLTVFMCAPRGKEIGGQLLLFNLFAVQINSYEAFSNMHLSRTLKKSPQNKLLGGEQSFSLFIHLLCVFFFAHHFRSVFPTVSLSFLHKEASFQL